MSRRLVARSIIVGVAAITIGAGVVACGDSPDAGSATQSSDQQVSTMDTTTETPSDEQSGWPVPSDDGGSAHSTIPTTNAYPPPYVSYVEWVQTEVGPSLQIHPTPNGRKTSDDGGADVAWREVLKLAPNADTPGMRAQFDCHWNFARLVDPNKPSWNIEPERPVVSEQEMIATRCNPGGPEE